MDGNLKYCVQWQTFKALSFEVLDEVDKAIFMRFTWTNYLFAVHVIHIRNF